ncbi:MAG: membrane protein insertion efficiency factor YidD [Verrucomicrobiia bacterium]
MKALALALLKGYRYGISPILRACLGSGCGCRHEPSCSIYAQQAIERFGFWRGAYLAAGRLFRCHPWGTTGYDPVPETFLTGSKHHG